MPYAVNRGVRIYYEIEGAGPPLVLAHGGSDSLEMWRRHGYTEGLKDDYGLVLFDFRGHGRSDSPGESSAYGEAITDDIIAVLDDLEILEAHYMGYSMGASAGYRLAIRHPDRFRSFILGGMTPYEWPDVMVQAVNISIDNYRLLLTDPDAYLVQMEALVGHSLSVEERAEFVSRDAEAAIAVLFSLLDAPALTDAELLQVRVPCMVYCGDQDPFYEGARQSVERMPRAAFLSMDGLDHVSAFLNSDFVLPYVKAFLTVVEQKINPY